MSKQVGYSNLPLSQVVDEGGIFLISSTLLTKADHLGITEDLARNWFTKMNVQELAIYVQKIWGGPERSDQKSLIDKLILFDLELDSDSMHLFDRSSEESKLHALNQLMVTSSFSEFDTEEKQAKLVTKLMKKLKRDSIMQVEMDKRSRPLTIFD